MATTDQYCITDAQMRTIMRLSDAANLLAAGLPPAYTTTPIGPLKKLSDDVAAIVFMARPTTLPATVKALTDAAAAALTLLEGTAATEDRDGHHNAALNIRAVEKQLWAALGR